MAVADRLQQLVEQNSITGIDFVYVFENQIQLDVYFFQHDNGPQANDIIGVIDPEVIDIYAPDGADTLPEIKVTSVNWTMVDDRTVLRLTTATHGDFTRYRLRLPVAAIDHYFNDVVFSFKANCECDLDCKTPEPYCLLENGVDFPVDYQARDFNSFRRALLEFASQRYPNWQDRLEADVGIMLAEVMSGLGDEMAYYQDRIAREAYLETASQRLSLRRHARLVDYNVHDGLGGSGWLNVTVSTGVSDSLAAGTQVQAQSDRGDSIIYEIGRGLTDTLKGVTFTVNADINGITPHIWDEDDLCIPRGATEMYVEGHLGANFVFDDPVEDPSGKWVVLAADGASDSPCPKRWIVRVTSATDMRDEVFARDITRLRWQEEDALPFEMELEQLKVQGNILPITAGETLEHLFVVGEAVDDLSLPVAEQTHLTRAVERCGGQSDGVRYLQTLPDLDGKQLVWLGKNTDEAVPEVHLQEVSFDGLNWQDSGNTWQWQRALLGVYSSQPSDFHFTLEDGSWRRVVGYWRNGEEVVHHDYAANEGTTLTFGDGEFGRVPAEGTQFQMTYRLGNGTNAEVAPDAISELVDAVAFVDAINNPFAIDNAEEPESDEDVRRFAPQAFRTLTYRAVRADDYAEAAERLPWVQRAGAKLRWTGSWLSLFATPDPLGTTVLNDAYEEEMYQQLDRFRQAGREVYVAEPQYADVDLKITVCVQPHTYRGAVKEKLLALLIGSEKLGAGYFSADHFTFGTPLRRTQLEAVVQSTPGVRAVLSMQFRRRGQFEWRDFTELAYEVSMDEVIRIENDPLHPARGTLKLIMEGGA